MRLRRNWRHEARQAVEVLEPRLLLAGDVSVTFDGGEFVIRGDDDDNLIDVSQPAEGMVRVQGHDGTTVNGQPFVEIGGVANDLRIRMHQGGDDEVAVIGPFDVPDDLRAKMGEGSLVIDGTVEPVVIGDDLLVRGNADVYVALRNQVTVSDVVDIATGGDVDVVAGLAAIPDIASAAFDDSLNIDNPYFPLVPGTTYTYVEQSVDEDTGEVVIEDVIVEVLHDTKTILGVEARVVRDRVFVDGLIIEDTFDWFAQDNDGNVWYMGEDVTDFEYDDQGNLIGTSHPGAFEAGVDGAQAGILMLAEPEIGTRHYQEVALGVAIDQAEPLAIGETLTVAAGTFDDVLRLKEITVLEPDALEHKFFAPGLGHVGAHILDEQTREIVGTFELISVELNGIPATEVVDITGFDGTNPALTPTGGVEIGGASRIRSQGTVTVSGAMLEGALQLRTTEDASIIDTVLQDVLRVRATDVLSLQNVTAEEDVHIRGDLDVYVFDSVFLEQVAVRLGQSDNLLAITGSMFSELTADGGAGENAFEDRGGNVFDELDLARFDLG